MRNHDSPSIGEKYLIAWRQKRTWKRVVSVLACFVVVGTISALTLPAITMNQQECQLEEHQHGPECFGEMQVLSCTADSLGIHQHTGNCFDGDGKIICHFADFLIHEHNSNCSDENGNLLCELPVIREHRHSESCYQAAETPPAIEHQHSEECYEWIKGENLLCGRSETTGHQHDDSCHTITSTLTCPLTEEPGHIHGDECSETSQVLICSQEEGSDHQHDESCHESVVTRVCNLEEASGHQHDGGCYEDTDTISCGYEETTSHQHTDACYELVQGGLICEEANDEEVTDEAAVKELEKQLICKKDEIISHIHTNSCMDSNGDIQCELLETKTHAHEAACFAAQQVLTCELPEHTHDEICTPVEGLTEEEQQQVDDVISIIEGLPPVAEIEAEYERLAEDAEGFAAYESKIVSAVQAAFEEYNALSEEQKPYVTNAEKLNAYKHLQEKRPETTVKLDNGLTLSLNRNPGVLSDSENQVGLQASILADGALTQLMDQVIAESGLELRKSYLMDISLRYQERSIQPDGTVQITVSNLPTAGAIAKSYHIDPETREVEALHTRISGYGDVVFETDRFSPFGIVLYADTPADLKEYVTQRNGKVTVGLLDKNGQSIGTGGEVQVGEDYTLSFGLSLPRNGFVPGTYTYQLPGKLKITPKENQPIKNSSGEVFGHWSVDAAGLITFVFAENADKQQDVRITIDMMVQFTEVDETIEFDGDVSVTVKPAPQEPDKPEPELRKSGRVNPEYPNKISWTIKVQGGEGYLLVGQTVTDSIIGNGHSYTEDDKKLWMEVYSGEKNSQGEDIYYSWRVSETAAQKATWTDTGWKYTIPETAVCQGCNDSQFNPDGNHTSHEVTIENDWRAYFYFNSTVTDATLALYENKVTTDGKENIGQVYPVAGGEIIKSGRLENGKFKWTITTTIPGSDVPYTYFWYIWDSMTIADSGEGLVNDLITPTSVKAIYNGQEVDVPYYGNATSSDRFAYYYWRDSKAQNGAELDFIHQCGCTAETCQRWDSTYGHCADIAPSTDGTYFCRCWSETEPVTFVIEYETAASADIISKYGGMVQTLKNSAQLSYKTYNGSKWVSNTVDTDRDNVPIPGVFSKKQITDASSDNAYTADFKITVNEERQDLSVSDVGVTIVDTMSDTLYYTGGTMVLTQVSVDETRTVLTEGVDFTLEVTNSRHTLNITIPKEKLGPYMYELTYSATVDVSGKTGWINYTNNATVTLLGTNYQATSGQQHLTSYTSTAENFKVTIAKRDSISRDTPLSGATFALYAENGSLIATGVSDADGSLTFQTSVTGGILFKKDTPYYILETQAPAGYMKDGAKHWFYFGDADSSALESAYPDIARFPKVEQLYAGSLTVLNQMAGPELPNTGGPGRFPYILSGWLFIGAAVLIYSYRFRKRKEAK